MRKNASNGEPNHEFLDPTGGLEGEEMSHLGAQGGMQRRRSGSDKRWGTRIPPPFPSTQKAAKASRRLCSLSRKELTLKSSHAATLSMAPDKSRGRGIGPASGKGAERALSIPRAPWDQKKDSIAPPRCFPE